VASGFSRTVRIAMAHLSTDRRRMVCEFEAPDAEAVRTSYRSAGVGFERVWPADVYTRNVTV
jgi:hypothetical protein